MVKSNHSNGDSGKKRDSDRPEPPSRKQDRSTKKIRVGGIVSRPPRPRDLESAASYVVASCKEKEYLSKEEWVVFRIGNAGDAGLLAALQRKDGKVESSKESHPEKKRKSSAVQSDERSLEMKLSEALGDEDTPPAIFALISDVYSDESTHHVGASAMMYLGIEEGTRALMVDWIYVDENSDVSDVLRRRLWLRLSTIAMLTSSLHIVVPDLITSEG